MAISTENICIGLMVLVLALLGAIYSYFQFCYQYWLKKGVPFIKPKFPLGNSNDCLPQSSSPGTFTKTYYDELKKFGHKFGGIYLVTTPSLVLVDPDYVKDVMLKDFNYFVDRGFYYNQKSDPISAHLFAIDGSDWRNLRVKLTPTFTSGKMKQMFETVVKTCGFMIEALHKECGQDLDIKDILSKFTTDVIGTCAFGIDCNSFKHPDAEFRTMGKNIFGDYFLKSLKAFVMANHPKLAMKLDLIQTPPYISRFFQEIVKEAVTMRLENNTKRNDFLQILIDLKENSDFSMDELIAQVFLFFVAGFETSSTLMTYSLYELGRNEDIQTNLRQEINSVLEKYNDQITYDGLKEMKLLAQVLDEASRMYPPLPTLTRRCTKPYKFRDTDVIIEKDTPVIIPIYGLHMDPEFFPNPEQFLPERFSEENKKNRHSFVHLPFGEGPRNCIGLRFGQMQSKIGVISVIKNFRVTVSPACKSVQLDPKVFLLNAIDPVLLQIQKI